MKVAVVTLGCRTNQAESSAISCEIANNGHQLVDFNDNPDVCIINSCTVTAKADAQSRQLISRALKRNARVIITGCYAHLHKSAIVDAFPEVHIVGNDVKSAFSSYLPILGKGDAPSGPFLPKGSLQRHRPVIKVQDGCDNSCSYCIIPKARGTSRSKAIAEVIQEVLDQEAKGYREVVLSGIHLGMYGKDIIPETSLKDLLEELHGCIRHVRIRLSSLEVNEIDEELLSVMQKNRICNHLHIPLQSASNTVLQRMNRLYGQADFEQCMHNVTKWLKNVAIGTDIIVGFPGETPQEFYETCRFLELMPFAYIHVFPYSVRTGTAAALMKNHVDERTKLQRVAEIKSIAAGIKSRFVASQVGQVVDVLIERANGEFHEGMSSNFCRVRVISDAKLTLGSIVSAHVEGVEDDVLRARPINC